MSYTGVCINGKAGAGKNHLAALIVDLLAQRGQWGVEVAFAEGVKRELWETRRMRKEDVGGREALVEIGHGRRVTQPDYWVEKMAERLAQILPFGVVPIITDCRYANELEWARRFRFVTVRVDASVLDRAVVLQQRGEDLEFASSDHPSECELDEAMFHLRFANPHHLPGVASGAASWIVELLVGEAELAA